MSAVVRTEFQALREAQIEAEQIGAIRYREGHDTGYRAGYAVAAREAMLRDGRALFIGICVGTGVGVILAIVIAGWMYARPA